MLIPPFLFASYHKQYQLPHMLNIAIRSLSITGMKISELGCDILNMCFYQIASADAHKLEETSLQASRHKHRS
jgi:hypothetical protein